MALKNICKSFSGVEVLRNVNLELADSEILALVGENGAGKSTLMKILTGIYSSDSGEMYFMNSEYRPRNPREAMLQGLGIVHQELNLMEDLTVAENVFIGRESLHKNRVLLNKNEQIQRTESLFESLNMSIDPREPLRNLTVGKQQMVEIARAVSHDLKILVLDEPSAALSDKDINDLFGIMKDMKLRGISMIYISHRLEEIHAISDRCMVLRDGAVIGTEATDSLTKADIISMMVGRTIYEAPKTASNVPSGSEVALSVQGLCAGQQVQNISFELRKGEILGFAGLVGAGRTETARAIFAADPIEKGEINIFGRSVRIHNPAEAVELGIGYLSEDRKRFGLAVNLNLADNMFLSSYNKLGKTPFVSQSAVHKTANEYMKSLDIRAWGIDQIIRTLSGGNQQKVVIAKWLLRDSQILIFDEPTRGIDVGAKNEIYHLMKELADQGKSIIMISSELPEILRMSDRIAVLCGGRLTGILDITEANQEKIMELATMDIASHHSNSA